MISRDQFPGAEPQWALVAPGVGACEVNMLDKPLKDVGPDDIQRLVDTGVPESKSIDYKQALPGRSEKDRVDFCKDVTALANAQGGDIVYGIRESRDDDNRPTGQPESVVGVGDINLDAARLRLTQLLRDGVEPFLFGVELHSVAHPAGIVLVVRVPRSLTGPHMVTTQGHRRFYVRSGNGTSPMDVDELRAAFLGGQAFEQRVDTLRRQRIMKLLAGEGPVPDIPKRLLIVHFIPLALSGRVDVTDPCLERALRPLGSGLGSVRNNLDGCLAYSTTPGNYSQLFRNGTIEGVSGQPFRTDPPRLFVQGRAIAGFVIGSVGHNVNLCNQLGVRPPFAVAVSFTGVRGHSLHPGGDSWMQDSWAKSLDNMMMVPELLLDEVDVEQLDRLARPLLDMIWQAFGFQRCGYYKDDGSIDRRQLA